MTAALSMVAGAQGSWSQGVCSQGADAGEFGWSDHFLFSSFLFRLWLHCVGRSSFTGQTSLERPSQTPQSVDLDDSKFSQDGSEG